MKHKKSYMIETYEKFTFYYKNFINEIELLSQLNCYVFIVHVLQHWIYPLFGIDALAMLPILSNRIFVFTLASYLLL